MAGLARAAQLGVNITPAAYPWHPRDDAHIPQCNRIGVGAGIFLPKRRQL
jgi:hypothetical protein